MYPWTTPPTSWPTPPQHPPASSTWPQSTPSAHLFGQPSPLHPTWSSSSSLMPPASTTPSLSFASLATAPHAVPAPHLVPTMTTPLAPETTIVHTAPPAFTTPAAPIVPTTWHTAPAPSHASTTPPTPLQSSPYPPRTLHSPPLTDASTFPPDEPRQPAVKAAPKLRSEKKPDKLRRSTPKASLPATPPEPTTAPSPPISPELAALGSTTQQLAESVRFIQAQQQMILDSQRAQEQRQQLLHQDLPATGPTLPTPSPTSALPTPMPPPAPKARPLEPEVPGHNIVPIPAVPIPHHPHLPTSPSRRPRSRTRRSRSRRPSTQPHHRRPSPHRTDRPRSPLPRYRSSTKHDKDRRTPSPYRRRSPPRRRSPAAHRRHRSHPPPRSRTPRRHSRGRGVILRPAVHPTNPSFIPTPDADDSWGKWNNSHHPHEHHHGTDRPRSPAGPPPPDPPSNPPAHPTAPLGAVAFRVPDGDSENSDAAEAFSISKFDKNDIELSEMVEAAKDPLRVRCLTELDPNYTVPLRTTLNQQNKLLFNNFVDEMFNQLAQPHRTINNELIFIKASQATVMNIARAFAQSRLLDIDLAKKTRAFYVEPENLLTITVPTGLPRKPIYRGEHAGTYLIYHKTSWETVAKILAEDCIRPATWTKNEAGFPTQYPCYGFFGMSSEIPDIEDLPGYAVKLCTSQLYRIGKGQNPSGLLAICRSPKCMRALSGGNDQIQRLCNLQGISKGKDNATAMNSSAASICYVASTHSVFPGLITHTATETRPSTAATPSEPPDHTPADREPPTRPNPAPDVPEPSNPPPTDSRATTTHHETTDHTAPDHARRHWNDNPSWDSSTYTRRDRRSSYREGHSRDQHREGQARSRTSAYNHSRPRW